MALANVSVVFLMVILFSIIISFVFGAISYFLLRKKFSNKRALIISVIFFFVFVVLLNGILIFLFQS